MRKKTGFPSMSPPGAICPIFKLSCTISNLFTSQYHVISTINDFYVIASFSIVQRDIESSQDVPHVPEHQPEDFGLMRISPPRYQ